MAETLRLTEAEWRDRDSLRQHWDDFCDADPVPEDFIDKAAGLYRSALIAQAEQGASR